MANCLECKHCEKFKYGYGCKKDRKMIIDPSTKKECFEFDLFKMLGLERKDFIHE